MQATGVAAEEDSAPAGSESSQGHGAGENQSQSPTEVSAVADSAALAAARIRRVAAIVDAAPGRTMA